MHIPIDLAKNKLQASQAPFLELFTHGTLAIELYQPDRIDFQQPHDRDEVYIIVSGHGKFYADGETKSFAANDFLFVPAGIEHRFIDFTDDFSTWVIFYGPEGGEQDKTDYDHSV